VRSPRRAIDVFRGRDLIEAGLNEAAAGFARQGLWGLYFYGWPMLSLGVAVNGAWSFKTQDESRRVRRKRSAARVLAALAHPRAYVLIAGDGDRDEGLGRSVIVVQIIEASLMTCRSEMAAWERGVAEKREKCAR
jgi:hypothetical protein